MIALLVVSLGSAPRPGRAQAIEGRVVDEVRGTALGLAEVRLLTEDMRLVGSTLSDSLGRYGLTAPGPGAHRITADAIGYASLQSPLLSLAEGITYAIDLELRADPVELDALTVEVEALSAIRRDLRMFGVRLETLGPRFVGPEEIARRATAGDFAKVLQWQSIPGMRIARTDDLAEPPPGPPTVCIQLVAGRGHCAAVVLNGAPVTQEAAYMLPTTNPRAIVVLSPDEATLLYGTGHAGGAVLLFTR